jgi:hypothetical protein
MVFGDWLIARLVQFVAWFERKFPIIIRVFLYAAISFLTPFTTELATRKENLFSEIPEVAWTRIILVSVLGTLIALRAFVDQTISQEAQK